MDFTKPWDYGDVVFVIEDKRIYVNRMTLEMTSDVFKSMLRGKKMTEIPLPNEQFDDFLQLMQILHPQVNKFVDETNMECMLTMAQEYQIDHVVENCKKYLMSQAPSIKNFLLAKKHNVPAVYEKCLKYLKDTPLEQLKQEEGFENLKVSTLNEVLNHKYETLLIEVRKIAICGNRQELPCPYCPYVRGTNDNCTECRKVMCKNHQRGTDRSCKACNEYIMNKIDKVVKQHVGKA